MNISIMYYWRALSASGFSKPNPCYLLADSYSAPRLEPWASEYHQNRW